MIGVTPFRVLITLLITYLLSPLPLQVNPHLPGLKAASRQGGPEEEGPPGASIRAEGVLKLLGL